MSKKARAHLVTVLRTIVHTFRVDFARKQAPDRVPLASKYSTKRVKSQDWPEVLGGLDARDSAIHGTSYPRGRLERARREEGRARKEG